MTTTVKVRKHDAEKVLAAVRKMFKVGRDETGPTLMKDWDWIGGHPAPYAVVWEEGPYEWAYLVTGGGVDQEMTSLVQEFQPGKVVYRDPIVQPDGVFCEPVTSWALGIYRGM